MRFSVLALTVALTFAQSTAFAEDANPPGSPTPSPAPMPEKATPPTPAPAPTSAPAKPAVTKPAVAKPSARTVPAAASARNSKATKGLKPFLAAIKKGDNAYLARDFDGALAAYREAVQKEPRNALGHYRIGEVQVAKNDLDEAEQALSTGLRFVSGDSVLKAKLLFCLSDIAERKRAFDQALERWSEYGKEAQDPKAKGHPASAGERKKVVEAQKQLITDYAEVKARIEKRMQEAEAAAKKSAK